MYRRIAILMTAICCAACSAPRIDNTRLGSADLVVMTDRMAESLVASEALAGRSSNSSPWIVTLDRVSNQTNDVIPEREKWAFMGRLRAQLAQTPLASQRNVRFVLPPEQSAALEDRQSDVDTQRHRPTHALTATFYAATTTGRTGRSDTYLCAFQLLALDGDLVLWEDRYEVKRAVVRSEWD